MYPQDSALKLKMNETAYAQLRKTVWLKQKLKMKRSSFSDTKVSTQYTKSMPTKTHKNPKTNENRKTEGFHRQPYKR